MKRIKNWCRSWTKEKIKEQAGIVELFIVLFLILVRTSGFAIIPWRWIVFPVYAIDLALFITGVTYDKQSHPTDLFDGIGILYCFNIISNPWAILVAFISDIIIANTVANAK